MEKIEIGVDGGLPLPIKSGFPQRYKSRKFNTATCYHIDIGDGSFILFQNIQAGPFSCWYSEYIIHHTKIMYCNMISDSVEFHNILEGEVMYKLGAQSEWFPESGGVHNILVNPPNYTKTAFSGTPVITFDIHISVDYFLSLMKEYPAFTQLAGALESGQTDTLFADKAQSSIQFRIQISKILDYFQKLTVMTAQDEKIIVDELHALIALYADARSVDLDGLNLQSDEIDTFFQIKNYIEEHYADRTVIADAQNRFPFPAEKLKDCFVRRFRKKPKAYVIAKRIENAKIFMQKNPDASGQQIAIAVGYLDYRHLNRLFIKSEGKSIMQYRAELQASSAD